MAHLCATHYRAMTHLFRHKTFSSGLAKLNNQEIAFVDMPGFADTCEEFNTEEQTSAQDQLFLQEICPDVLFPILLV